MTATFDRDKARAAVGLLVSLGPNTMDSDIEYVLDQMAACVVEDPRIARIEALPEWEWDVADADSAEARSARAYNYALEQVRAILRGES